MRFKKRVSSERVPQLWQVGEVVYVKMRIQSVNSYVPGEIAYSAKIDGGGDYGESLYRLRASQMYGVDDE